ncbi:hypothetical protein SAMN02745132_04894 [Enterovibrio nigricans DSM 22720]|uniref:Uncharacterized protein n=1 Tax=Enterovibrio nigricans DSM 22720 TaxID=1121868 RepID=A0A1T4WDX6_9GAMM|nr:hypothetical protein SAMN02745132_04894 [Enterovibrio nigricans DSM 22720]
MNLTTRCKNATILRISHQKKEAAQKNHYETVRTSNRLTCHKYFTYSATGKFVRSENEQV